MVAKTKVNGLDNCIGYVHRTVIEIEIPGDLDIQNVCYKLQKWKHALKFQEVHTEDGMLYYIFGPVEGGRHDRTLYIRSGIDRQLESSSYPVPRSQSVRGTNGLE